MCLPKERSLLWIGHLMELLAGGQCGSTEVQDLCSP